jgi:hypothetical protein
MASAASNGLAGLVALLTVYTVAALILLWVSALLKRRFSRGGSGFSVTIHLMALLAFLVGCLVAWLEYTSDNPFKDRLLLLPFVLPLCIYGYILTMYLVAYALAGLYRFALSLLSRPR